MPILACGSEGEQCLYENTLNSFGLDDKRRGSVRLFIGQQMIKRVVGTNDMWFHIRMAPNETFNTGILDTIGTLNSMISIRDSSSATLIDIRETGTRDQLQQNIQIRRRRTVAGGVTTNAEVFPQPNNEFYNFDFRVQVSSGSSANDTITYSVYINEVLRFQETNVDDAGWTVAAEMLCQPRTENPKFDEVSFQDFIISDSVPTVGMELATLVPSAVGTYDEFTNNYVQISEQGYNQSSVIAATAAAQRESWIFATPSFNLGDKVIYAVVFDTVAQTDIANVVTDFQPFLRIANTNYAGTNLGANNIAPNSYITEFQQNPSTTQPWTQADLSGLQAGFLSV